MNDFKKNNGLTIARQNMLFSAFTLAEVLITLAIIGVVAAFTIPVLVQNTQKRELIVGVKKAYSVLSQATERAIDENGNPSSWTILDGSVPGAYAVYSYFSPYLRISKECQDTTGCWYSGSTKSLYGGNVWSQGKGIGSQVILFVLNDGMNFNLDIWNNNDINRYFGVVTSLPTVMVYWADVNGDKGPNQIGRDTFAFVVTEKGLVAAGSSNASNCSSSDTSSQSGFECAAVVLKTDAMNY